MILEWIKKKLGIVKPVPPSSLINIGNFWCESHFNHIVASQTTNDPIDYHIATIGVGRFITLSTDHEVEGPLQNACDRIPKEVLEGIFTMSRGWQPLNSPMGR